jgi:acyl carrier protein phosphodiesterase
MNWLAHLFLSEPSPAFRIGNLLPDLVGQAALAGVSPEVLRGVRQHRQIDAFTDSHPIVRRSITRVGPKFRRFGGIFVDIFYDHFLSREWPSFSAIALPDFTREIYSCFESHRHEIPHEAHVPLDRMKSENWLSTYGDLHGVATTLGRIGLRLRRPTLLAEGAAILEADYAGFHADFTTFFPELMSHVHIRNEL